MSLIEWDATRFSVNVKRFDDDHRELVDLLNDLHSALKAGQTRDILAPLLGKLTDYARLHMSDEEVAMERYGYPELAAHKREHAEFAEHVANIRRTLDASQVADAIDLMDFLRAWLFNHILGTDRLYARFFAGKNV
jgi:hemerythrin